MAKKKTPPKVVAPKQDAFVLTLNLGGDIYSSTGETLLDALHNLPKPSKIMMWGVLKVEHGEKIKTMRYTPFRLKRLFYAPSMQAVLAKYLSIGLK